VKDMDFDPTKQPVRLKYDGEDYVVKYRHVQEQGEYEGEHCVIPTRGYTEAYIEIDEEEEFAARAFCSDRDNFDKRKGRIISTVKLAKLIDIMHDDWINDPEEGYTCLE